MSLRVVHLEDDPRDVELVAETLRAEQIDCSIVAVASQDAFERALDDHPDLILSDFAMPGFDGGAAQAIAHNRCPEVPFVFVSGSIGEDKAVERLKCGATDYVLKEHLDKLPTAVRRALREAEDRRERAAAEAALRRINTELEARVEERTRALTAANNALHAARREADRANRAKSDFLSRMSHDLRTPLNAITGFAELLQMDPLTPDQADSVTHILRGGRHLLNLITEILDIARIEAGRLNVSLEPVQVSEVLGHAIALVQPLAGQRHIAIHTAIVDAEVQVFADRQRLNQVLLNLLSNAIKYNREGGQVRMRVRPVGSRVRIDVADTGAGIPREKLQLLFTPFERLGAEQSGVEGTGLGLALSKALVEAMHGTLRAASVIDEGTTFSLELPGTNGAGAAVADSTQVAAIRGDVLGTVLYIEDNAPNAQLMRRILSRRPGVSLRHAADGRSGLAMLTADPPDLVILDLHLFDMSGEEVMRHIWENPRTRGLPVAVLSADATPGSRRRLLASGAFRYLTKPFEIASILQLIDEVLPHA
jgi:signal transduction histidine kinase